MPPTDGTDDLGKPCELTLEALRAADESAVRDMRLALRVTGPAGARLGVACGRDGSPRAAVVLLPTVAGIWRVVPTATGAPAWLLPQWSALPSLFDALPSGIDRIDVDVVTAEDRREAESLAPRSIVRRQRAGVADGRAQCVDRVVHTVQLFRDESARLRHLAKEPLRAWCKARRERSTPDGVHALRATSLRVDAADAAVLALLDRAARLSIQYGSAWLQNFAATVRSEGAEPWLHVLWRDNRPLLVLPLLHGAGSTPGVTALANYYTGVWAPAMADGVGAPELVQLLRHVLRAQPAARSLSLAPMDGTRAEYSLMTQALCALGLVVHEQACFGNWYLPSEGLTWSHYLAGRSAGLRSTLKRLGTKFQAEGGRMELVTGGARLEAGIDAYESVYRRSWKVPEPHPRFMPELMRACAERGWLRLGIAWADEQPVAAQFWIVAHGRADIFKVAYDEAYARFSVGSLLTGFLMQHVLDVDRVGEVDFLIGDDAYKKTWMSARRERWGLVAHAPWTLRGLYRVLRTTAAGAWRARQSSRATRLHATGHPGVPAKAPALGGEGA